MKERVNDFFKSLVSLKIGITLFVVPFYFYWVDTYQPILVEWLIKLQTEYTWGKVAVLVSAVGFVFIREYFKGKGSSERLFERIFSIIAFVCTMLFFWLLNEQFAYVGILSFVIVVYLAVGLIFDVFKIVASYLVQLESNLQLTLIIPILTVILNYFFTK